MFISFPLLYYMNAGVNISSSSFSLFKTMTRGCILLLLLAACTVAGAPVVVNEEPGVLYLPNNAIVLGMLYIRRDPIT